MNYFAPKLSPDELRKMSAIALAHMGDAVYETPGPHLALCPRYSDRQGPAPCHHRHVCAPAQAEKMQKVLPLLTDEEQAVYKRGRNANVHTMSPQRHPGPVPFRHRFGVFNGLFILKR